MVAIKDMDKKPKNCAECDVACCHGMSDCPLIEIEQSEEYQELVDKLQLANETNNRLIKIIENKGLSSEDCVSREQVLLQLTGENLSDKTPLELIALFDKRIKDLPPVTPTHGTCKNCKYKQGSCCNYSSHYLREDGFCNYFERGEE